MNFAVEIHDDKSAFIAPAEEIPLRLQRLDKGFAVASLLPAGGDVGHALLFGNTGALLLLALGEIFLFLAVAETLLAAVAFHAVGQFKPVIAAEFAGDGAQLEAVVLYQDRLDLLLRCVDTGPDDMAVFARHAVSVALFVEDDGARLAGEGQAFFGAGDEVEIFLAGQAALPLIGGKRETVIVFFALLSG